MKQFHFSKSFSLLAWLALLGGLLILTGCATAEPDNLSVRPWNSPEGWEGGLPSSMFEGR